MRDRLLAMRADVVDISAPVENQRDDAADDAAAETAYEGGHSRSMSKYLYASQSRTRTYPC